MKHQPLYINDFALVNALGSSKQQIIDNLFGPRTQWMTPRDDLLHDGTVYVGEVKAELPEMMNFPAHFQTRNNQLALLAYQQIAPTVEALKSQLGVQRIAIILGSSTSGIASGEDAVAHKDANNRLPIGYDYRMQEMSNVAEFIAEVSGLQSICMTISTACSSSAKCFITAQEMIESGVVDAAIVGGVDSLCGMTINGFHALDSLSAGICRPSGAGRDGINIGEAAAFALLSKQPAELQFVAGGESSDAHHMSAPHPEGEGAKAAIQVALDDAGIEAEQIDYINLHGTATPKNDAMEALAVAGLFPLSTPVSSTKALTGHTLGAAGATEAGLCCLVLQQQRFAPHQSDGQLDEDLPPLNFVTAPVAATQPIEYCLSNSFAFGGSNVSLIFRVSHE